MDVFEYEQKKLKLIKNQYDDLINQYEIRVKKIPLDYKINPVTRSALMEQYTAKLTLLKRTISNPFFGRIDFTDDENAKKTVCYIGKVGVIDDDGNTITVDWRAPIASLYYDSNVGKAEYEAPLGIIKGNLELKRQFEIKDSNLISFQDVNAVSDDELLKPYLSLSADNRSKNIVSTIQSEQNAIIRKNIYTNNIIQGAAGSGKTTVALHRIAFLIYNEQKRFKENQFIVIGPNDYFMNFISSVLPDLDANAVTQYTFLDIVNNYLGEKFKIIDQNARLEKILNGIELDNNIRFKSSLDYREAIDKFVQVIESKLVHGPIKLRNIILFDENDINRFLQKKSLSIMERIKEFTKYAKKQIQKKTEDIKNAYWMQFRDEFMNLPKDSFRSKEIIELTSGFDRELTNNIDKIIKQYFKEFSLKPLALYKLFIEECEKYIYSSNCDIEKLRISTLNSIKTKVLGYEDLAALMYLNLKFYGYKDYDKYAHVVIDEAQDYGLFHFEVIKKLFKNSTFSIFGDLAQSIYSYQSISEWESVINKIFEGQCNLLKLEKSYRTTYEIMNTANSISKLFGFGNAQAVLRHGPQVEAFKVNNNLDDYILCRINEFQNKNFKSIALICKDENTVSEISKLLKNLNIEHNKISAKNTTYDGGICVIPCYLSKGLEFDAVIINDIEKYNSLNEVEMKLLYVAVTRALHQLEIIYKNELIEPLKNIL